MTTSPAHESDSSVAVASHAPRAGNRYVLAFGAFMLVGIMVLAWIGRAPTVVTLGQKLPPIDLQPLLDGAPPLGTEQMEGKMVLLHFWGTWCPPCKEEFPEFANVCAEFSSDPDLLIASVSCSAGPEYDLEQLKRQTEKFMAQYPQSLPTYADPAALTRERIAWILPRGSLGYPTTLLVDRDGKIIDLIEGYYPGDMEKLGQRLRSRL